MLDQGTRGGGLHTCIITKHAMFRTIHIPTIDVGHAHIPYPLVTQVWALIFATIFTIGVIPMDTSTATMATKEMVFGMFRHHYRMVPVATLARNLSRHGP